MRGFASHLLRFLLGLGFFGLIVPLPSIGGLTGQERSPVSKRACHLSDFKADQKKTAEALRLFSDRAEPEKARLKAAEDIDAVDAEGAETLLKVFGDENNSEAIRIIALQKSPANKSLVERVARCIRDQKETERLKLECVVWLHTVVSFDAVSHVNKEGVTTALHAALRDKSKSVRYRALGYLVLTKDPVAHQRLLDDLGPKQQERLFEIADAIRYVAMYDSREDLQLIRYYFITSKDRDIRAAAAEALTADKDRFEDLHNLLFDPKEIANVKISTLRGLSLNQPKEFRDIALRVIADGEVSEDVRAWLIEEFAKVLKRNYRGFPESTRREAKQVIAGLEKSKNTRLREAAELYRTIEEQLAEDGRGSPDATYVWAVIHKAIKAAGGVEKLTPFAREPFTWKRKLTGRTLDGKEIQIIETGTAQGNKVRMAHEGSCGDQKVNFILVCDSEKGYRKEGDEVMELDREQVRQFLSHAYHFRLCFLLDPLRDRKLVLEPAEPVRVEGQPATGVKVTSKEFGITQMYFNESGQLLRSTYPEVGHDYELLLSQFKEMAGVRIPTKAVIKLDRMPYAEIELVDLKREQKLDRKVFEKP
jgi:hypothetical protein